MWPLPICTTIAQLRELNETNHGFTSLSEAHNFVKQAAELASLAARSPVRQASLVTDWYQQMKLKIMPKEYRPTATSLVEQFSNYRGRDLNPHEILACLNRVRYPIDDLMRTRHQKGGFPSTCVKIVYREDTYMEPTKTEGSHSLSSPSLDDLVTAAVKVQPPLPATDSPASNQRPQNSMRGRGTGRFRGRGGATVTTGRTPAVTEGKDLGCKLCGNPLHSSSDCPLFPEGSNGVAAYECRKCKAGLFYFSRYCPRGLQEE